MFNHQILLSKISISNPTANHEKADLKNKYNNKGKLAIGFTILLYRIGRYLVSIPYIIIR